MPASVFDNYFYQGNELESFSFYDYLKIISWAKYSTRQKDDILFDKHHLNPFLKIQQPSNFLEYNMLIGLVRLLFINKSSEDVIRGKHSKTDARQNNVALVLFALFIL